MKAVTVVTDSVACLPRDLAERHGIIIVPLNIISEGKTYRDGSDITATQAYELFLRNPDSFSTSAPSPADFLSAFQTAAKQSLGIFYAAVSSKLSSTYQSAITAREYALKEIPGARIEVMDTLTATSAEGFISLTAARAAEAGASLDRVLNTANAVRKNLGCYVLLDTVKHVYRSGRIPRIAASAGSFLNIRPLFKVDGTVRLSAVVRSRERGIEVMIEKIRAHIHHQPIHASVMHAYAPDAVKQLMARIAKEFNCIEMWESEFSPLMGYACGTGTLGVAFYPEGNYDK